MGSKISYSNVKPDNYYGSSRPEMLDYVPVNVKRTLEFGCGRGAFSELIRKRSDAECWGVELNDQSAQIASEKLHRVIRGEANECIKELPDAYFECIIFNDLLEHLADPFTFLTDLKAKLAPEGVVVSSIPNVRFWNNLRDFAWRGEWDYREAGILDSTHLRFFTYKSLLNMFKTLGYRVLRIEGIKPTHNTKFKILNFLLWNKLWDARYHHFACVIRPEDGGPA